MRIAIIGAGRVGTTLGARWTEAGHEVVYGVRDPSDSRHDGIGAVADVAGAATGADVVVVALPWDATESVLQGLPVGDAVVIDATNPLAANARQLSSHPELSGAELIAGWLGSGPGGQGVQHHRCGQHGRARLSDGDAGDALRRRRSDGQGGGGFAGPGDRLRRRRRRPAHGRARPRAPRDAVDPPRLPLGHGPDIAFSLLRR